jgi:hypothetical protein
MPFGNCSGRKVGLGELIEFSQTFALCGKGIRDRLVRTGGLGKESADQGDR